MIPVNCTIPAKLSLTYCQYEIILYPRPYKSPLHTVIYLHIDARTPTQTYATHLLYRRVDSEPARKLGWPFEYINTFIKHSVLSSTYYSTCICIVALFKIDCSSNIKRCQ